MGLWSGCRSVQWDGTLVIAPFSGIFSEILGYMHAWAFSGTTHFLRTGGDASQSLFCVYGLAHVCVRVV
jgi:hypothetical protein